MQKKNTGITLIATVITIIVLLILVTITITYGIKGNVLSKAVQGKNEHIKAQEEELLKKAKLAWDTEKETKENIDDQFQSFITNELNSYDVDIQNAKKIKYSNQEYLLVTFNETKNKYKVTNELIEKIEPTPIEKTEIKIGDYVNYIPSTDGEYDVEFLNKYSGVVENNNSAIDVNEDGKIDSTELTCSAWRILRLYPDGSVDLIGNPTNKSVTLRGTVGYDNGVFLLNDICKELFSNKENNIIARSVNINDLESYLTEQGLQKRNEYINMQYTSDINNAVQYGTPNTLKGKAKYPIIYDLEKNTGIELDEAKHEGIDASDSYYTKENLIAEEELGKSYLKTTTKLTAEVTDYSLSINQDNYGEAYNVLVSGAWIATRITRMETRSAIQYCMGTVRSSGFNPRILAYSSDRISSQSNSIRPVVSLPSNSKLIACTGKNSNKNPHQIEY